MNKGAKQELLQVGSSGSGRTRSAAILLILAMLLLTQGVIAQSDTTPEGPVTVSQCETGARCSGGDDCINGVCNNPCEGRTNPFCACDCDIVQGTPPGEGDIGWIVIVGVGGIAAVGVAIALKSRTRVGKKEEKNEKKEKKSTLYILQVSTDRLTIGPDSPGTLTVTVWKKVGDNPPQQAPEAAIAIRVPPVAAGLKVVPPAGQGMLRSAIRIEESIQAGEFPLTVTASAAGGSEEATVTVKIEQDYIMEFF